MTVIAREKLGALLDEFHFSAEEVARFTDTAPSTVYARRALGAPKRSRMDEALDRLYFVVMSLRTLGADNETARGWLVSRSMHLRGEVPLAVLKSPDRVEEVLGAAKAYSNEVPASEYLATLGEQALDVPAVREAG